MRSSALKQPPTERRRYQAHDPTFYPTEEKVGQDTLQMLILELLRPLIERWYKLLGKPTFVGADQFIYYKCFHPSKVVAPDIYVLPGVPPGRRIKSWKTWKTGLAPSLAIEVITSEDSEKDYREAPERYAELGVLELIIFDADFQKSDDRVRWQRYRKLKTRGFVRVEATNADRIRARVLGCFLRVVGEGDEARLRLGTGTTGDTLVPTEAEAERTAKQEALAATQEALAATQEALAATKAERAEKEEALAAKDAERAEKEEALAAKQEALAAKDAERAEKEEALAAKDAERAEKEEALAAKQEALAAKDAERAEKEEALRQVAELKALLVKQSKSKG